MEGVLVIGTMDVSAKDQLVLRAMLRLLEGGINIRLRYSEQVKECDVVFVPRGGGVQSETASACVLVEIDNQSSALPSEVEGRQELVVHPPLRLPNVLAVLQRAVQRIYAGAEYNHIEGMRAMLEFLCTRIRDGERRRTVLPLTGGQQIVLDYTSQQIFSSLTLEQLLAGAYQLGKARRVSPVEEELIRSTQALNMRDLMWGLQARLGEAGVAAGSALHASYRLRRWPDTMALSRPNAPKLVAMLIKRPLTVAQASAGAGMHLQEVEGFLHVCLALEIAQEVEQKTSSTAAPAEPSNTAMPQWLQQLRKHLRLW